MDDAIATAVRKVTRKATWTVAGLFAGSPPTIETLLRRSAPPGHPPGDLSVRKIVGPNFLEPEYGYVITPGGRLISDPATANWPHTRLNPGWRNGIPSPREMRKLRRDGSIQRYDAVISLRHWWEWNFYHFHIDVLAKLLAFEEAGLPRDIPVVIGDYFDQVGWVREILKQGQFAEREWVVHDAGLIEAESIYYCHARYNYRDIGLFLAKSAGAPRPNPELQRRVFLNRRGPVNRQIVNIDDVTSCLASHGYEEIDSAELTIREQMQVFADTRYLVAIHGAGLTNVLYRQGAAMNVIELYGEGYNTFCFRDICRDFGYKWIGIAGKLAEGDPQLANIVIDVKALESALSSRD